jgi:hypothetical protein
MFPVYIFSIAALYRGLFEELNKLFQNEDGGIIKI